MSISRAQSLGQLEIVSPQESLSHNPLPHLFWQLVSLVVLSIVVLDIVVATGFVIFVTAETIFSVKVGAGVKVGVGVATGVEVGVGDFFIGDESRLLLPELEVVLVGVGEGNSSIFVSKTGDGTGVPDTTLVTASIIFSVIVCLGDGIGRGVDGLSIGRAVFLILGFWTRLEVSSLTEGAVLESALSATS